MGVPEVVDSGWEVWWYPENIQSEGIILIYHFGENITESIYFQQQSWLGGDKIKALIPMSKVINEMEKARVPRAEIIKYLRYIDDPMERRNLEAKFENYQFWHVSNIIYVLYNILIDVFNNIFLSYRLHFNFFFLILKTWSLV